MAIDIYKVITARILRQLETGTAPWRKPWRGGADGVPANLKTGKPYRGINVWLLATAGYDSRYWLTFKQAKDRGGHVRKGETSTPVVFWKWLKREERNAETGETHTRRIPLLRYYRVFNVEQCEGIEAPDSPSAFEPLDFEPIEAAERIARDMPDPPELKHGAGSAAYVPALDLVRMPERERFTGEAEYYSTLFHELVHATGHERRLGRPEVINSTTFGSGSYSREELLAEMGAAYLCGMAGIENHTIDNSAAYLAGWIKALKGKPKLVIHAAAGAQRAADFILNRQFDTPSQSPPLEAAHV